MKSLKAWRVRPAFVVFGLMLWASDSYSGTGEQGFNVQGFNVQGFNVQGFNVQGFNVQGFNVQGFNVQGFNVQGFNVQGFNVQGFNVQGFNVQGFNVQGFNVQGFNVQGLPLLGIDRLRGLAAPLEYRGLAYADVQTSSGRDLQGLQQVPAPPAINYVQTVNPGPRLQAGPSDTNPGSYIYVPGLSGSANDIKGTFWNMLLADSTGTGAIGLYVADVAKDTVPNQSKYSSNDDVTLYTVYYRQPATREWVSLCPVDPVTGKATAMAIPIDAGDWTTDASRAKFTFACTATGVGAKCARNWGYKPWKTVGESVWNGAGFVSKSIPLQPFYDACVIAARADYCQDGQSYTKNGTLVDLFDTLDGITSINPTAGLPYTPGAQGPMMHEEYQISALDFMSLDPPSTSAKPHYVILPGGLTPEEQAALSKVRRSGMQSSRYEDLDPGRSCLAAPFVDRCDPHEPYACYRDTNMSATPYGAFLSVNSPRHCDHDEDTPGAPLDPLCNTCVSRVCSVDPTCCGDPGSTFYPGSLVWDGRCSAIRDQVCKSAPSQTKWAAGQVAAKAGTVPTVFLRGAVGSFEGIVTTNGTRFVEGWACDPDFPGASSPIQISLGGPMAATGATLYTAVADQPLTSTLGAGWRETVAAECGGVGRHGFRFPLPAAFEGDVYIYGIDLNTPGAPFMLLRGGKKTTAGGTAMPNPLSVIWTGWLEPSASGMHAFSVDATDKYRVWVNGAYLLGNFVDPDATVPGAFLMPPPAVPAPPIYLQKGVRYGVRVEYLRASSATTNASRFSLRWTPPGGPEAPIPASALYPAAQGTGNGLLGTYWNSAGAQNGTQTYSAVDHVWTSCEPPATSCTRPAPGIRVEDAFTARFEGQVMPPVSGDYTFTADTDGAASISVNGTPVTDASRRPPGAGNPDVCGTRDVCRPGAAISRTCDQGYFCAAQICLKDPSCCSITWDAACVQKVATVCNLECRATAPITISLRGGVKYDIKVDFSHAGGRGARLKLYWGLGGGARDSIPAERLFAAPAGAAPAKGVGLNAAYFSDAFKAEYFDRVEPSVAFAAASPPRAALLDSIACGFSGGPACDATEALGAPALVAPAPKSFVVGPSVTLRVTGAATGSTIAIAEKTDTTSTTIATFAYVAPSNGSPMQSPPIPLALGKHRLTVAQSVLGKSSGASAALEFTVVAAVDPTLPAPPVVTVPAGGLVATNGKITVSGTAAPGAKVSVGGGAPTVVNANATTGAWSATINLPAPGVYPLTFTQTVGGKTTATGAQVAARYAIPPITVTTPPATETAFAGSVSVTGTATPGLTASKVIVADGDGRYFAEVQQLDIGSAGGFPAPSPAPQPPPLTLDPGRHVLKIFQRVGTPPNVLDGEPVIRTVLITPAAGALAIDCPAAPGVVSPVFTVTGRGTPARTGLRYGVAVYQGNGTTGSLSKLGQVTVDDQGVFTLPVQLTGAGSQQLRARLLVSSLSGGGAAESGDSPICNVVVKPQRPTITLPGNGFGQTSTTLNVRGTGLANAPLSFFAEETTNVTPATNPTVAANGTFNVNIVLARGPHRITVKQSAGVATSDASNPVTGTIGDVVPPKFTFANTPPELPPKIERTTSNETGLSIDFVQASGITAKDGATILPVTCVPAGPSFFFPLGTTNVTCKAQDAAGNVASTTLTITVKSSAAPLISGINLVAEATGPEGAAVAYQVSATGFVANCAPTGSTAFVPCSGWQRKSLGLGNPWSLANDPVDGTLYAVDEADPVYGQTIKPPGTLMKSVDRGATWTPLPMPGTNKQKNRLTVVRAPADAKATLYVPSTAGLLASLDGGNSWKTILPGIEIAAVSVDPRDPQHLFAWNRASPGEKLALLETTDGGTSWGFAADGLPIESAPGLSNPHVSGVAFDPLNAGRIYALVSPDRWDDTSAPHLIYRRIGNAPWERRSVPPVLVYYRGFEDSAIAVAPKVMPCNGNPICPTFPTVFVGGVMSTDGGDTWTPNQDMVGGAISFLFDRHQDGVIYTNNYVSRDHGRTWGSWPVDPPYFLETLFQDPVPPLPGTTARIYGQYGNDAPHGMVMTADAGAKWSVVKAPINGVLASINTVAVDAVDPRVAYMLSNEGLFKTQDGGDTWDLKISGALENFYPDTQLAIDPFNPRLLYVTGNWHINVQSGHMSMDGGDTVSQGLFDGIVGTDPGARNVLFHGPRGLGVRRYAAGVSQAYAFDVPAFTAHYIQVLPDAARTVAVSYSRSSTTGGTILFPGRDAQVAPATTNVRQALTGMPARPVFDNSDGRYSVFASGDARGSTPNLLFKASVSDLVFQQIGGGQPTIDFRSLVIDGGSGGQLMYTVGIEGALWQSQDAGKTWATDPGAPTYVHRVWASPVDGALYVASGGVNIGDFRDLGTDQFATHSTIWKRTLGATPPGASIVEGNLRVTCTGDSGRSVTPGSMFPIGTTTLSCTATDVFGAITTQPITIQVKDSTAPVLTVPAPMTVTTTSTDPNVVVPVSFTVTANDAVDGVLPACTPQTPATQGCFSCTPASGSGFKLGVTTVACTARDSRGKQAAASFPVIVKRTGTTPAVPTLNVPANMTVEATGPAGAQANPVVTATKSTGAALTPTCTPAVTTTFPLGTTTVSCAATDSGFTVTRTFNVTVADTRAPVITVPSPGPSVPSQGSWGATVNYTAAATDVVDGALPPGCVPGSGSVFAPGTTKVVCRASDKAGNAASAQFNVVVQDVSPPVLTVPALVVTEQQDILGARVTYSVSATDAQDPTPPTADCIPSSGTWFPPGDTSVSCQATDLSGNTARKTFIVRVADTTPPEVTAPATLTLEATTSAGAPATFTVTAFDTVDQIRPAACTRPNGLNAPTPVASGATFASGITTVTCTAADLAGNVGTRSFNVIVRDTKGPVLMLPSTRFGDVDASGVAVVTFTVTATDLGTPVPVVCTPPSGTRFLFGTTVVTCVARDAAGNEARGSFNVTVRDRVAPVFSQVPATVVAYAPSTAGAAVTYTKPVATDAFEGVRPVTCAPASGSTFVPGQTTVTCTASDSSANTRTATFIVWVQYDTRQPDTSIFLPPLKADGSSNFIRNATINVAFALKGASAPITNLVANAFIAPVSGGVPGTFVPATPASGSGNGFLYNAAGPSYTFLLSTAALTPGTYRIRADLADGVSREVNFNLVDKTITITPPAFLFADTVVMGQGSMAHFDVRNIGTAATTLTMILPPADFTILGNTCTGFGSIPAGGTCFIDVRFMPMNPPGPKHAMLTVNAADGSTVTAFLDGRALRPAQLALEPPTTSFGSVPLLTPGPTIDVTVRNLGEAPTGPINISLPGPDFAIVNNACPSGNLPGLQTCHLFVRFTPMAVGSRAATLTVSANPGGNPSVSFSGVGISPLSVSPSSLTFPGVPVGMAGQSQVITVRNLSTAGSGALTTTVSPPAFRVTANTCASLAGGATCNVTIQWFPTAVGTTNGSFSITGPPGWQGSASLTGTGL